MGQTRGGAGLGRTRGSEELLPSLRLTGQGEVARLLGEGPGQLLALGTGTLPSPGHLAVGSKVTKAPSPHSPAHASR